MATVEVFTVGGGEYIVNTFNAVAAWTGLGGYKSMLQVVLVMAFGMASLSMAFDNNWRAWINWFLQATLIYMCLMVPRLDVHVTDRINPSLAPADVANVPLGLGLMASFTSQIGDYLTTSSEVVFGLPNDLNYSTNGMVYGARLMQAVQNVQINDPEFSTNLDEHMRNCVFYDVLLGRKSMQTLATAPDLWASLAPGSQSRAQKYLTRQGDGTVTSEIKTCREAYDAMSGVWASPGGPLETVENPLSRALYPKLDQTAAKAKLLADLGGSYTYLTGVSQTAAGVLKQNLLVNAMSQAMHAMPGNTGVAAVDVYAQTRAEIQTRNTYSSIAQTAMKWVPLLHIVLTVMFYALFPVIFPLFLLPGGGIAAVRSYVTGFFYLAAWGPLFVILHMILMFKGLGEYTSTANGAGTTLMSAAGIGAVSDDISLLAGYLIASVPFIAGGIAKGALAISGNATSFLAPSQAAAEEAAREASTGNIAAGNTSLDNFSFNTRQGNGWSTAPTFTSGASAFNTRNDQGGVISDYGGSTVVDQRGAISSLGVTPTLTSELQSTFTSNASESRSRGETLSNSASSSFATANTRASDFRSQVSAGSTLETSYGSNDAKTIGDTFNQLDQAATEVQNRFGTSRRVAENLARETFYNGQLGLGLRGSVGTGGAGKGPFSAGADASATGSVGKSGRRGASQEAGADASLGQVEGFLQNFGHQHNWAQQREAFDRASQNTTNGSLRSQAQSVGSSFTEAANLSRDSRRYFEQAEKFETLASLRDSNGLSISENASQRFVNYAVEKQRSLQAGGIAPEWNPTREPTNAREATERQYWVHEFAKDEAQRIKDGYEPSFAEPTPAGLARPTANSQSRLHALSEEGAAAVRSRGLPAGTIDASDIAADRAIVAGDVGSNARRIDGNIRLRGEWSTRSAGKLARDPRTKAEALDKDTPNLLF